MGQCSEIISKPSHLELQRSLHSQSLQQSPRHQPLHNRSQQRSTRDSRQHQHLTLRVQHYTHSTILCDCHLLCSERLLLGVTFGLHTPELIRIRCNSSSISRIGTTLAVLSSKDRAPTTSNAYNCATQVTGQYSLPTISSFCIVLISNLLRKLPSIHYFWSLIEWFIYKTPMCILTKYTFCSSRPLSIHRFPTYNASTLERICCSTILGWTIQHSPAGAGNTLHPSVSVALPPVSPTVAVTNTSSSSTIAPVTASAISAHQVASIITPVHQAVRSTDYDSDDSQLKKKTNIAQLEWLGKTYQMIGKENALHIIRISQHCAQQSQSYPREAWSVRW